MRDVEIVPAIFPSAQSLASLLMLVMVSKRSVPVIAVLHMLCQLPRASESHDHKMKYG